MNINKLATAIRQHADKIRNLPEQREGDFDTIELLCSLARIIEGKRPAKALGAPGDWGYSTPIGQALAAKFEPELTAEGKEIVFFVDSSDCEGSAAHSRISAHENLDAVLDSMENGDDFEMTITRRDMTTEEIAALPEL